MPNINDINGVTIANLSKLDGVTKANIAKVLGITLEAAAAFLLDTYTGAAAAYSVRRIASGATNLMRIREDSGDTETDIGYDSNGDLDTAAIASHCGTANGFVVSWVDQSSNGNDATQSTSGNQPQIYNGTAVITENGKPVITCGNGQQFQFTDASGTNNTWTAVIKSNNATNCLISTDISNAALGLSQSGSTATDFGFGTVTYFVDGSSFTFTRGNMYTAAQSQILFTAITGDPSRLTLLTGFGNATTFYSYNMQELIQWPVDQTSPTNNRTGIESDINGYFSIY